MSSYNPEQHNTTHETPADPLTISLLASMAEEFALNGEREKNGTILTYQNSASLNETQLLYAAKYFTADAAPVAVGDKMGEILIYDFLKARVPGRPIKGQEYSFTNYYFIRGEDADDTIITAGKHQFVSASKGVLQVLAANHDVTTPARSFDHEMGVDIVTQSEADALIQVFASHLDQEM